MPPHAFATILTCRMRRVRFASRIACKAFASRQVSRRAQAQAQQQTQTQQQNSPAGGAGAAPPHLQTRAPVINRAPVVNRAPLAQQQQFPWRNRPAVAVRFVDDVDDQEEEAIAPGAVGDDS